MSRTERKKNIIGGALLALVVILLGVLIFQNFMANAERDTAQTSAAASAQQKKNLAEEVADACQSGQVIKSAAGVDLCARAESIAQQPVKAEGPQGPAGPRGLPGADGLDGAAGDAGAAGKAGSAGTNGTDGDDGAAGATGAPGAAGLNGAGGQPGPAGAPGKDGAAGPVGPAGAPGAVGAVGPAGTSPTSFTFTDSTGHTYICTPDPPGSPTYTCTSPEPTP